MYSCEDRTGAVEHPRKCAEQATSAQSECSPCMWTTSPAIPQSLNVCQPLDGSTKNPPLPWDEPDGGTAQSRRDDSKETSQPRSYLQATYANMGYQARVGVQGLLGQHFTGEALRPSTLPTLFVVTSLEHVKHGGRNYNLQAVASQPPRPPE